MQKLICSASLLLIIYSCNKHSNSNFSKICDDVWRDKNDTHGDSILRISIYNQTENYIFYWVSLNPKPFYIKQGLEKCYERINDKTVFWNKCQQVSNDYNYLIRKEIISIGKSATIDDSFRGEMYIFKTANSERFRKITLSDFFTLLSNKTPNEPMSGTEQNRYYDLTADYLW